MRFHGFGNRVDNLAALLDPLRRQILAIDGIFERLEQLRQ